MQTDWRAGWVVELKCCLRLLCRIWLKQVTPKRLLTSYKAARHHFSEYDKFHRHLFPLYLRCLMLWPTERWTKCHTNLGIVCYVPYEGEGAAILQAQDTDVVLISLNCFLRLRTKLRPRKGVKYMVGMAALEAPPLLAYFSISHQSALRFVIQRKQVSLVYIIKSDILTVVGAVNWLESGLNIGSRFLISWAEEDT